MPVCQECEFEFCSDPVGSADKNRMLVTLNVKFKKSAEAADIGAYARRHGFCDVGFHQFDRLIARGDVNACVGIGF